MHLPRTNIVLTEAQPTPSTAKERAVGLGMDREYHVRVVRGNCVYLPGPDVATLETKMNVSGREVIDQIPVIPDGLKELSQAWLNRWAYWVAAGRPDVTPVEMRDLGDAPRNQDELNKRVKERKKERERAKDNHRIHGFSRTYNPALHPRDPNTGKFVERVFDVPDTAPSFENISPGKTLKYLSDRGENVQPILDRNTAMTIDGIPDDAESMEDVARASNDMDVDNVDEPLDFSDIERADPDDGDDGDDGTDVPDDDGDDGGDDEDTVSEARSGEDVLDEDLDLDDVEEAGEADLDDSLGEDRGEVAYEQDPVDGYIDIDDVEGGQAVGVYNDNYDEYATGVVRETTDTGRDDAVMVRIESEGPNQGLQKQIKKGGDARVLFDPATEPPEDGIYSHRDADFNPADFVEVEIGDETVAGKVKVPRGGRLRLSTDMQAGAGERDITPDMMAREGMTVTKYPEADTLRDLPSVGDLDPSEGGLIDVSGTDTSSLSADIRKFNDYIETVDRSDDRPIDEAVEETVRERLQSNLDNIRNEQIKREYARRTLIGDDADLNLKDPDKPKMRANNARLMTPHGSYMNRMTVSHDPSSRTIDHEMGHGLGHMAGYKSQNTNIASAQSYFDNLIDPRNPDDFQQYLIKGPDSDDDIASTIYQNGVGFKEFRDELDEKYIEREDEFTTLVDKTDADTFEVGDVVRFEDSPADDVHGREFELMFKEHEDNDDFRTRHVFRDDWGTKFSLRVKDSADDEDSDDPRIDYGAYAGLDGDNDVKKVNRGHSPDLEPTLDNEDSRFMDILHDEPTIDEYREQIDEQIDDDDWEEYIRMLIKESNRAFYKMHLRHRFKGTKEPLIEGYSSTTAGEIPSQLNELFQTGRNDKATHIEKVAKLYPRLTAAMMEIREPSPLAKEKLQGVNGVSVDLEQRG